MPILKRRGLIRAEDLPRQGANFQIKSVTDSEDGVSTFDLMLKPEGGGDVGTLGIKPPSQNTDKLIELFGENTDNWVGNYIRLEPATFHGQNGTRLKINIRSADGFMEPAPAGKKGK